MEDVSFVIPAICALLIDWNDEYVPTWPSEYNHSAERNVRLRRGAAQITSRNAAANIRESLANFVEGRFSHLLQTQPDSHQEQD